jgi:redox-sensitive bicupin YhaK (pirin superfamily)
VLVIDGSIRIGDETLAANEIGWLDPVDAPDTLVRLQAGPVGGRALLYAGAPLTETIVHRGPFVAGSPAELSAQFSAYRAGEFQRITEIPVNRER